MKKPNILISLILFIAVATSCSNDEEYVCDNAHSKKVVNDVVYCFDLSKHLDEISSLDSLESINIPIEVIENENTNKIPYTRSGEIIPVVGKITNLGNKKTLYKYGVGENLVPSYYCGSNMNYATIEFDCMVI